MILVQHDIKSALLGGMNAFIREKRVTEPHIDAHIAHYTWNPLFRTVFINVRRTTLSRISRE